MKILFVSTLSHVSWGGSEELWSQTAVKLSSQGHQVSFVSYTTIDSEKLRWLRDSGIYDLRISNEVFSFGFGFLKRRLVNKQFYSLVKKVNPELVIISMTSHYNEVGFKWMHLLIDRNIPFINIFQLVSDEFKSYLQGRHERCWHALSKARMNYFVSEQNRLMMERHLAMKISNFKVIWNPFKGEWDQPFVYPALGNTFNLAMPAAYVPMHKGQDILFESLASDKWRNRNLKISLFGSGSFKSYLVEVLRYLKIDFVTINDHQMIDEIWSTHHGMILPSRMEGMSLSLIEAMMYGRFVISTDLGGAREVIEDNVNGFIAKAPWPEFIDEALERAWQRRAEWEQISSRAYLDIRKKIPQDPIAFFVNSVLESA